MHSFRYFLSFHGSLFTTTNQIRAPTVLYPFDQRLPFYICSITKPIVGDEVVDKQVVLQCNAYRQVDANM